MAISLIRTAFLYALVIIAFRVMGKRQIGELQPADLAIAIMISDLAAIPMQDVDIPILYGVVPIFTLIIIEFFLSAFSLKSKKFRDLLSGKPSILIYNGVIDQKKLKRLRYNLDDLLEELRLNNYPNVADVDFAILETNGKLSVLPKPEKAPLTPSDMNIPVINPVGLPLQLISDGHINYLNLKKIQKDVKWLEQELKKHKLKSPDQVFYMAVSNTGEVLNLQRVEKGGK